MTDKNTISKKEYMLIHIVGAVLLPILIPAVTNSSFSVSLFVFVCIIVLCECNITLRARRNYFSVFVNMITPAELVVLIWFYERNTPLTVISLIVWALLSGMYIYLVMNSGKSDRRKRTFSRAKIRWSLLGSKTIFSIVMIVSLLFLTVFYREPPIPTQVSVGEFSADIESCEDSLSRLSTDEFKTLSEDDRLDVLRDVCKVEFSRLGIKHGFSVECEELNDVYLAGYCEGNYTITINKKEINRCSSFVLMQAMCHECYHAYQHSLLTGDDSLGQYTDEERQNKIDVYTEELSHYYKPEDDLEKYKAQFFERDANTYADRECVYYLRFYGVSQEQISQLEERMGINTDQVL